MKHVVVSPALNKRLISNLMSTRTTTKTDNNFILKGTTEFASRSSDVFKGLQTLEKDHETWVLKNNTEDCFEENSDKPSISSQLKSSSSSTSLEKSLTFVGNHLHSNKSNPDAFQFKKPESPRKKILNKTRKQRKKWTKYSLEDIPISSNSTNTSVALAFIDELRKRKTATQEKHEEGKKIVFSKPQSKKKLTETCSTASKDDNLTQNKLEKTVSHVKLDHLENESYEDK